MVCLDGTESLNPLVSIVFRPFATKEFAISEGYYKGSASVQTTKPVQEPKLGSSLAVPVGNPNENPNFNQVVPVLVQGNALKAFRYRLFHVLYQNVVIVMALIRQPDRCLTPPSNQEGGRLFSYPLTKFL